MIASLEKGLMIVVNINVDNLNVYFSGIVYN